MIISRYLPHYCDVIMATIASQITSLTIVYSTVYSGADQRKHQSSASLAFAWGIHRGPVYFPHKGPVTRKMFPFDDVIMANFSMLSEQMRIHTSIVSGYFQSVQCLCRLPVPNLMFVSFNSPSAWLMIYGRFHGGKQLTLNAFN